MRKALCGLLFVSLASCSLANAVEYDHSKSKSEGKSFDLNLSSNEEFTLDVLNTCENTAISWHKVAASVAGNNATKGPGTDQAAFILNASCDFVDGNVKSKLADYFQKADMCLMVDKKSVTMMNEPGISGYVVEINVPGNGDTINAVSASQRSELERSITDAASSLCSSELEKLIKTSDGKLTLGAAVTDEALQVKIKELKSRVSSSIEAEIEKFKPTTLSDTYLVINTGDKGWTTDFSGGILVSGLTSKEYRVDNSDSEIKYVRSKAAEDNQRLELGAFTHVYHSSWVNSVFKTGTPAITGGISVNNGDTLDYFVGLSLKFGAAYLNVGSHWGQVSTGPTNYPLNTALSIDEAAATTALEASANQTRTDQSFFISLSFSFAGQGAAPVRSALAFPTPKVTTPPASTPPTN